MVLIFVHLNKYFIDEISNFNIMIMMMIKRIMIHDECLIFDFGCYASNLDINFVVHEINGTYLFLKYLISTYFRLFPTVFTIRNQSFLSHSSIFLTVFM